MQRVHFATLNVKSLPSRTFYTFILCALTPQTAYSEPVTMLRNPFIQTAAEQAPNMVLPPAIPPAMGDGDLPNKEIPGDTGASPLVASGQADHGSGSKFNTVPGSTYKAPILVPGARRGETLMQYTEKYPYPNVKFVTIQGKKYQYIDADSPAAGYPQKANKWTYGGLPTVQRLSRYLVILGVVVATILMAFAAYGVVLGEQNAGTRVIHTAGGLMLLFMAFTIWKLVLANMAGLDRNGQWDANTHKLPQQILLPDAMPTRVIPQAQAAPQRAGVPVFPDSGN